jgi:hypothetical protein
MKKIALLAGAALIMASGINPAEAQWRRAGWYGGHGGWYGGYYRHRGWGGGGALAAGLVGGAVLGGLAAAAATPAYGYGYGYGYPANSYPAYGYNYAYPAYSYPAYGYGYGYPAYNYPVASNYYGYGGGYYGAPVVERRVVYRTVPRYYPRVVYRQPRIVHSRRYVRTVVTTGSIGRSHIRRYR